MLGIILWAVLILIIAICVCPGYLTFLLCVGIPIGIAIFALVSWIQNYCCPIKLFEPRQD